MKTDKFEKTIRRKLESITPEFHEDDWTKMQNYMHAHTPPTFWQQYSSWLGYAAAAAVTSVMAFLYVNQLSQNNDLLTDVKTLKNQIEVIKNTPTIVQKTDTVYLVQKQPADKDERYDPYREEHRFVPQEKNIRESLANAGSAENSADETNGISDTKTDNNSIIEESAGVPLLKKNPEILANNNISANDRPVEETIISSDPKPSENIEKNTIKRYSDSGSLAASEKAGKIYRYKGMEDSGNSGSGNVVSGSNTGSNFNGTVNTIAFGKTLDSRFDALATQSPIQENNFQTVSRRMNYSLARRISPSRVKSVLLASSASGAKMPVSEKNNTSAKKAETTIPKLNLKVPYRFGFAQQWEGKNQVRTAVAEVIVAKHFSISTGFSWLKIKPKGFYSEKSYREKTKKNFRDDYKPHLMPFEGIENINIKPSVMQIPLTVAYRNDLKNDFAFFVGAGTNFTVSQKQDVEFDCYRDFFNPTNPKPNIIRAIRSEKVTEKMNLNLVNSLNFSAGIEKSWHPVVLQAEAYLYTYFSPLSPQASKSGPGLKIKVLYQIGKKM
ncbi:hypothetical protein SAMN04487995_1244 [Dyadobacter koreensis]|uniref:Outer membrane protein beta-barrel domain-containing protein n=1 Tax=Dyadobacter koreensis TaxID=408657 RepID=A0A1H6RL51_9BACT|nr:hypothetical protein [Dyadobacter koreensis]SEI54044.1 hypothetical protein SAMN04487995_1244 [Dyadobacter koreensis]